MTDRRSFIAALLAPVLSRFASKASGVPGKTVRIQYTTADMQFVEYRRFSAEQICRLFRVDPDLIVPRLSSCVPENGDGPEEQVCPHQAILEVETQPD
jgi:hypothetical protein